MDLIPKCKYCLTEFSSKSAQKNMSTHVKNHCQVFRLFKIPYEDIINIINNHQTIHVQSLELENKRLKAEVDRLKTELEQIKNSNFNVKQANQELSDLVKNINPNFCSEEKINNDDILTQIMQYHNLQVSTKKDYAKNWTDYSSWCSSQQDSLNPLLATSANLYIRSKLNCPEPSFTIKKIRNQLQTIMSNVSNKKISLEKIRKHLHKKRKRAFLSRNQLNLHLLKEKQSNPMFYLIKYLQAYEGLRINAVANLRREHLFFMNNTEVTYMEVPDLKTGSFAKQLNIDTVKFLREYVILNDIQEGFLFKCGTSSDPRKRSAHLSRKINNKMEVKISDTYSIKIRSHDFRRTCSQLAYEKEIQNSALKIASESIGHKNMYNTQAYYLKSNAEILDELKNSNQSKVANNENNIQENNIFGIFESYLYGTKNNYKVIQAFEKEFLIANMSDSEIVIFKNSFMNAMNDKKFEFTDDLIYSFTDYFSPNEPLQVMSSVNIEIFEKFKALSRKMQYAPVEVVLTENQGYAVKATNTIKPYTLICEYAGEVVIYDESIKDDSLMDLIKIRKIEYVIYPGKKCNLARFISGINNKDKIKKKKQNLNSIKFNINGMVHIILYCIKPIKKGDFLYYDYNAGNLNEYDTKNFD